MQRRSKLSMFLRSDVVGFDSGESRRAPLVIGATSDCGAISM